MSGYYTLYAPCFVCNEVFSSNPNTVPSLNNQPICRKCIKAVNAKRREVGKPEWPVAADAYEPLPEGELP